MRQEAGGEGSQWHSYRCPVCGHTDEAVLRAEHSSTVSCPHCATSLEVLQRAPDQDSAAVKIATRWRRAH